MINSFPPFFQFSYLSPTSLICRMWGLFMVRFDLQTSHPPPHTLLWILFQISKEWRKVWWFVMILIAGRIQKWGGSLLIWFSMRESMSGSIIQMRRVSSDMILRESMSGVYPCLREPAHVRWAWRVYKRTSVHKQMYLQIQAYTYTRLCVYIYTRQHTCKDTRHRASTDVTPQLPSDLLLPNLAPT